MNARGRRAEGEQIELESAGVEVRAGDDQAIARLAAPVGDLRGKGPWPIEFRVTGDLARLEARARPLLPRGDWRLAGRFTASGKLTCEEEQATLTGTRIELEGLALRGPRLNFQESKSELVVGSAQWRWKDHRLDVPSVVFSGARLGVGLEPLRAAWSRGELSELDATVAVRTTLERVQEWATAEAAQPAWLVRGRLAGGRRSAPTRGNCGRSGSRRGGFSARTRREDVLPSRPFGSPRGRQLRPRRRGLAARSG